MPDARHLTLILGGARSGKSAHAERLATSRPGPWTYVATAQAFDAEMSERIDLHRARRAAGWETTEAPLELADALRGVPSGRPMLLDCLTLWLSNHLLAGSRLEDKFTELEFALASPSGPWFVVSNEVGMGIVPDNALSRRFRDEAGRLNQRIAALAGTVLLMVAGLPLRVK